MIQKGWMAVDENDDVLVEGDTRAEVMDELYEMDVEDYEVVAYPKPGGSIFT